MNTLVVYYSRTGNVAAVAKELAIEKRWALEEIIETDERKGPFSFLINGMDAWLKRSGEILPMQSDFKMFLRIIICTPVWAGTIPPAVRTFLIVHESDISEVEYIIMHSNEKNDYQKIFDEMDNLLGKKRGKATSLVTPKKPKAEKPKRSDTEPAEESQKENLQETQTEPQSTVTPEE